MNERQNTSQTGGVAAATQAERWFARMRSDRIRPVDEFRFRRWLEEDPANEREYRALETLWHDWTAFGQTDAVRTLRQEVNKKGSGPYLLTLRRRTVATAAAVAMAAVLIGGLFAANPTIYTATYGTGVGGRNSHHLLDGTRITLNTDTALKVQYDLRSRRVWLENGQAHFEVTRSRFWPFEVDAGASVVRALGTTFDVYRRGDEIQVTLLEGRVRVEKAAPPPAASSNTPQITDPKPQATNHRPHNEQLILRPGQQVTVNPLGVSSIRRASLPETTAWLHGRLVFDGERLADAIAEVNRYSPVRLTIENPELADVRISGVFRAGGAETFVDALEASFPVQARVRDDGSLVLAANVDGPLPEHIGGLSR